MLENFCIGIYFISSKVREKLQFFFTYDMSYVLISLNIAYSVLGG